MASTRTTCSLLTVLAVTAAPVALSQTLPPALIACAIEKKDKVRLECFDREVARVVQGAANGSAGVAPAPSVPAQPAPAAPAVAATQPPPAPTSAEDEFGLSGELARKRRAERQEKPAPTELRAAVAKVSQRPYGEYVIELDNGQVWEQNEKKSAFVIKVGDNVVIRPAKFGSFMLSTEDGATSRVHRTR